MNKIALIIGVGGQDGSYLADLLLSKGYEVHAISRRTSTDNLTRIAHIRDNIVLHWGDLSDGESIARVIRRVRPTEIYNEADQDHVGYSKSTPQVSIDITAGSVQRLLETVLDCDWKPRVFQPISATIFHGTNSGYRLDEWSDLGPDSPYACAKAHAYHLCGYYRRRGVDVRCGIMFNHESERRSGEYLLQRIISDVIAVSRGKKDRVQFSNTDMTVDIGYAPEYIDCSHRIMQLDKPNDYVIGTGRAVTIDKLIEYAFSYTGHDFDYDDIPDKRFKNELSRIANTERLSYAIGYQNLPKTYGDALVRKLMEHKGVVTNHGK